MTSVVAGFASAAVHAILVLIALRIWNRAAPVLVHFVCALLVHLLATIAIFTAAGEWSYWHMASIYWFLFMFYLYVYSAFYKSLSLRILVSITEAPGRSRAIPEILDGVILPSFRQRTRILIDGSLVTHSGSGYIVTGKGKKTVSLLLRLRRQLNIKEGGLYFN